MVGEFLRGVEPGVKPFAAWRREMVLSVLRELLKTIGVDEAEEYVAHDVRRGHADDLLRRGATLLEIFTPGDWRFVAFLTYLDAHRLERNNTMEAHLADSNDDE